VTQDEMTQVMNDLFADCKETRASGQKEYAHDTSNAFRNFESLAKELNLDRKKVLWIYLKKHLDGILAAINGHVSQREPVRGRIKDAIVYLVLLEGMFEEDSVPVASIKPNQIDYQAKPIQPMQELSLEEQERQWFKNTEGTKVYRI